MSLHYVYIIYSESFDRFYVGETGDVGGRIMQHNTGFYRGSSTKYDRLHLTGISVIKTGLINRKSRFVIEIGFSPPEDEELCVVR